MVPPMQHYDARPSNIQDSYQSGGIKPSHPSESYPQNQQNTVAPQPLPQVNIVQRISAIIKSQLPMLQSTMLYAERKTQ